MIDSMTGFQGDVKLARSLDDYRRVRGSADIAMQMPSEWYKKRRAAQLAPVLVGWTVLPLVVGVCAIVLAKALLRVSWSALVDPTRVDFATGTFMMIAVASFVFAASGAMKLMHLCMTARMPLVTLLRAEEE